MNFLVLVVIAFGIGMRLSGSTNLLEAEFELATDELIGVNQELSVIKPVSPLPVDFNDLTRRLRERAAKWIGGDRLVFYEKGKARRESTRRALLALIALELSVQTNPARLGEALKADYRGALNSGSNIHLYKVGIMRR
ncbi:MAG: hypothetical protein ACJ07L_11840 [Opitutales bacterium]